MSSFNEKVNVIIFIMFSIVISILCAKGIFISFPRWNSTQAITVLDSITSNTSVVADSINVQ